MHFSLQAFLALLSPWRHSHRTSKAPLERTLSNMHKTILN